MGREIRQIALMGNCHVCPSLIHRAGMGHRPAHAQDPGSDNAAPYQRLHHLLSLLVHGAEQVIVRQVRLVEHHPRVTSHPGDPAHIIFPFIPAQRRIRVHRLAKVYIQHPVAGPGAGIHAPGDAVAFPCRCKSADVGGCGKRNHMKILLIMGQASAGSQAERLPADARIPFTCSPARTGTASPADHRPSFPLSPPQINPRPASWQYCPGWHSRSPWRGPQSRSSCPQA